MSDDKPMSAGEVKALVRMTALEVEKRITESLESFSEKQRESHQAYIKQSFEQATGYAWENRGKFKGVIAWAHSAKETHARWRNAGIVAFIGLGIKAFWKDIFPGN